MKTAPMSLVTYICVANPSISFIAPPPQPPTPTPPRPPPTHPDPLPPPPGDTEKTVPGHYEFK